MWPLESDVPWCSQHLDSFLNAQYHLQNPWEQVAADAVCVHSAAAAAAELRGTEGARGP